MTSEKELSHAERNGLGWMDTIRQHIACLECDRERLEELRDERDAWEIDEETRHTWAEDNPEDAEELAQLESDCKIDGEELDADAARERIEESPLSVQVRSGWRSPGDAHGDPEEFEILLSTGGPALRIVGDLDQHCQPTRARLEHQDWGTPWTEMILGSDDYDTLLKWAGVFYFGD